MRDPFIAIDSGTDLKAHARLLRRSWEAALGGGTPDTVRQVIGESWLRMAGAGLDPERLHPRRALGADELADARAASALSEVMPTLRRCLGAVAHDAEHVMVVCDRDGRVLWMEGDRRVRRRAEGITFTEGMLWTEDSAGTNAIGTALAIDHAVQIFTAEHFLPEQHRWWCSAAPIHDPASGELLGIVDLSGPMRTAHPHSLALVMAAAGMAEDVLRFRHAVEQHRLRQLELEHELHPGAARSPATAPAPARMRLRLLGRHPFTLRIAGRAPVELGLRHAEILALLAMYPDGLTAEQLALHLYGEEGNRISARAEISRLRKLLGPCLAARPYRLVGELSADFLEVERRLAAGEVGAALRDYRGSLLVESEAPRIEQARDELEGAVRRAAAAGSLSHLWAWLQTEPGRDDLAALALFVKRAPAGDPRRAVAAARARSLRVRWGLAGEPATA